MNEQFWLKIGGTLTIAGTLIGMIGLGFLAYGVDHVVIVGVACVFTGLFIMLGQLLVELWRS